MGRRSKQQGGACGNGCIYRRSVAEEFDKQFLEQARHAPQIGSWHLFIFPNPFRKRAEGGVRQAATAPTKHTHFPHLCLE